MVVVEHLDEDLDLGPLGDLLLAHGCDHLAGIAVDARDQSVAVRTVGCAIVNILRRTTTTSGCGLKRHTNRLDEQTACSRLLSARVMKSCSAEAPDTSHPRVLP